MRNVRVDTLRASGAGSLSVAASALGNTSSENERAREVAQGNLKTLSRLAEVLDQLLYSCRSRTRETERALERLTAVQNRDAASDARLRRTTPTAPGHVRLRDLHSRDAAHAAQNAEQARSILSDATDRYVQVLNITALP